MNIRSKLLRLLAILFAFGLVAAACGSSDDDDSSSSSSESATATADYHGDDDHGEEEEEEEAGGGLSQDAVEKAVAGEDDGGDDDSGVVAGDRSTIEGIWEEAAATRASIIEKITAKMDAGEWGVNSNNILIGPSGFEIDLNDCPGDWSNSHGVTDSEIRVGQTTVTVSYTHLTLPTKRIV